MSKSINSFDNVLELISGNGVAEPGNAETLWLQGVRHEELGDIDRAIANQQESTDHLSDFYGRLHLAGLLEKAGRLDEAVMQYEAAAALNPQIADVRLRLARVLVRRGCRNAAREELHEAIRLGDGATIREAEELLDVISAKPLRDDGVLWFASLLSDRPCWAN